ncbi:MAG: mannitol dehydrogenase family protein [Porphyrobacter sp.]|nr:mannitol dehydrogenase family protein [Porphyrobacter sp.]
MRLSAATAGQLPDTVQRPAYDRSAQARGIVHFGLGAFTRAHQAAYTDAAMVAGDEGWMITGVSLRSASVAEQLNPQDGFYLIAERSGQGTRFRLGGAIRNVLTAPQDTEAVIAAIADPATRIVSFTVTEKGYCRAGDGSLDMALAGPGSFYPLLTEGMRQRRAAGMSGVTLLSCDNLAHNGAVLERLMRQYLAAHATDLAEWFAEACTCPSTMVDRIVPATTDADRAAAFADTGLADDALVVTEPFSQWVIEDRFAAGRPRWEAAGVQLVADVAPYETAKLRMLNGAHSLLAYCGLEAGYTYVHEAIADATLCQAAQALMADAAATIATSPDQDLTAYAASLIDRFRNPALNHRLAQIAMDGSQKIPQRWLETLAVRQRAEQQCPAILRAIAAWISHLRGKNCAVDDPMAESLFAAATSAQPVQSLFGEQGVLASTWNPTAPDTALILSALR